MPVILLRKFIIFIIVITIGYIEISNLQTFLAVAETGSFSLASEQLCLTQPAISKRIAQLENDLDTRLFDRIGRTTCLTESGEALLPRARRILQEIEDSRRTISNLSGRVGGLLKIATSHHIGLHRLPPVLRHFTSCYPEVELDLHFMDSEAACRAVTHGDLEIGIVTLPLDIPADLHTRLIWPDPLDFVISPEHSLATTADISARQLCDYPAILPGIGTYTRELVEQAFKPLGLAIPIRMSTNYLETIKMMVSIGLGWSVLPRSMLSGEISVLSVDGIALQRQLGSVWHKNRTLGNAATAMLELLEQNS